jgi:hypothetical protein
MGKSAKRKKGGVWGEQPDSRGQVRYGELTGEEALLLDAQILCFHPRSGDALAWIWPDGRLGLNAVYFSKSDAEEMQAQIRADRLGSE